MPIVFIHIYGAFFPTWNITLKASHLTCRAYVGQIEHKTESRPLTDHAKHDDMLGALWDFVCESDVSANAKMQSVYFTIVNSSTLYEKEEVGRCVLDISALDTGKWKELWFPLSGAMEGALLGLRVLPEGCGITRQAGSKVKTKRIGEASLFAIPKRQLVSRYNTPACTAVALCCAIAVVKCTLILVPKLYGPMYFDMKDLQNVYKMIPAWKLPTVPTANTPTKELLKLTKARQEKMLRREEEKREVKQSIREKVDGIAECVAHFATELTNSSDGEDTPGDLWMLDIYHEHLKLIEKEVANAMNIWEAKWIEEESMFKITRHELTAKRTAACVQRYVKERKQAKLIAKDAEDARHIPEDLLSRHRFHQDYLYLKQSIQNIDTYMDEAFAVELQNSPKKIDKSKRIDVAPTEDTDGPISLAPHEAGALRGVKVRILNSLGRTVNVYLDATRAVLLRKLKGIAQRRARVEDGHMAGRVALEAEVLTLFKSLSCQASSEHVAWAEIEQIADTLLPQLSHRLKKKILAPFQSDTTLRVTLEPWKPKAELGSWFGFSCLLYPCTPRGGWEEDVLWMSPESASFDLEACVDKRVFRLAVLELLSLYSGEEAKANRSKNPTLREALERVTQYQTWKSAAAKVLSSTEDELREAQQKRTRFVDMLLHEDASLGAVSDPVNTTKFTVLEAAVRKLVTKTEGCKLTYEANVQIRSPQSKDYDVIQQARRAKAAAARERATRRSSGSHNTLPPTTLEAVASAQENFQYNQGLRKALHKSSGETHRELKALLLSRSVYDHFAAFICSGVDHDAAVAEVVDTSPPPPPAMSLLALRLAAAELRTLPRPLRRKVLLTPYSVVILAALCAGRAALHAYGWRHALCTMRSRASPKTVPVVMKEVKVNYEFLKLATNELHMIDERRKPKKKQKAVLTPATPKDPPNRYRGRYRVFHQKLPPSQADCAREDLERTQAQRRVRYSELQKCSMWMEEAMASPSEF